MPLPFPGARRAGGTGRRQRAGTKIVLAAGSFSLRSGISETCNLPLTRAGRRILRSVSRQKPLHALVVIKLTHGATITEPATIR